MYCQSFFTVCGRDIYEKVSAPFRGGVDDMAHTVSSPPRSAESAGERLRGFYQKISNMQGFRRKNWPIHGNPQNG
jgi:hypothetical protein